MSEQTRQRRLHVTNRLQELLARHGPPEGAEVGEADGDPSWGFLGTLAQRVMDPAEYARLIDRDRQLIEQERAARGP